MCWELIDVAEKAKVKQWLETEATAMKKIHRGDILKKT